MGKKLRALRGIFGNLNFLIWWHRSGMDRTQCILQVMDGTDGAFLNAVNIFAIHG
ncbi:hypothetical protein SEHO0A_03179 [Salmonella enterica subsp. houtenae str. ATCC BAA-1581]|nr:hypothetical protein SEHO0A_03179 [Salmonella enterica subsp. houtenae str. ATCC BAA-1581]